MKPTTSDVLKWAREVYLYDKWNAAQLDRLERFAAIAYAAGAEAMKERCAKEFDRRDGGLGIGFYDPHEPAEIIRALGDSDD